MVEKSSGHQVKTLRSDNGGEYLSDEFQAYLKKEGIEHELTVPRTPEQNGVAETMKHQGADASVCIREHGSVSLCRDGQKTKWRLQCKY